MKSVHAFAKIGVVGGGAWGTALANLAARNGVDVLLWAREAEVAAGINKQNENPAFLPGIELADTLAATNELTDLADRDAFLFAAPVQFSRGLIEALRAVAAADAPIAFCSKGIERASGRFLSDILNELWPAARPAVLSGPSFAAEVAHGLPTAVTLAAADEELGAQWVATVGAKTFRPYLSDDLVGAELGGAIKNVLAIAAGVVDGRKLGESARSALIARGFAEFQRLGLALGAKSETLAGLSGLGDLILTASSRQSRNMSLGAALGEGRTLEEIVAERRTVSEGVATAEAVIALARRAGVEVPVCEAVADLVAGRKTIDQIVDDMLSRPFTTEI